MGLVAFRGVSSTEAGTLSFLPSAIEVMFIDAKRYVSRLRQEGHVSPRCVWILNINQLLPGVGREGFRKVNMALLNGGRNRFATGL